MNSFYFSDFGNNFGWRYDSNNPSKNFPKQHGHKQHSNITPKSKKLMVKKSRRINRGKKFNHN